MKNKTKNEQKILDAVIEWERENTVGSILTDCTCLSAPNGGASARYQ